MVTRALHGSSVATNNLRMINELVVLMYALGIHGVFLSVGLPNSFFFAIFTKVEISLGISYVFLDSSDLISSIT